MNKETHEKPTEFFNSEERHVNLQFDFQGYSFEQKKIIMDALGKALKKITNEIKEQKQP